MLLIKNDFRYFLFHDSQLTIYLHCYIFCSLFSEPSVAPNDVSFSALNQTTFNISLSPLARKESYGKVISYEVKASLVSSRSRLKRQLRLANVSPNNGA